MKIYVVPKKALRNQYYSNKEWFDDKNNYFISIAGLEDGCEYPNPFLSKDSKRVLHLLFDDVTESEKDNPSCILFNETHADKIFNFVKTIPIDVTLYVNCAAGVSRSGAVGYLINEYINRNNSNDYKDFEINNSHILPNPMIVRILKKKFFGLPFSGIEVNDYEYNEDGERIDHIEKI